MRSVGGNDYCIWSCEDALTSWHESMRSLEAASAQEDRSSGCNTLWKWQSPDKSKFLGQSTVDGRSKWVSLLRKQILTKSKDKNQIVATPQHRASKSKWRVNTEL